MPVPQIRFLATRLRRVGRRIRRGIRRHRRVLRRRIGRRSGRRRAWGRWRLSVASIRRVEALLALLWIVEVTSTALRTRVRAAARGVWVAHVAPGQKGGARLQLVSG